MSGKYRGVLKVAGPLLGGWLIDVARPSRRIRFNLVIDDQVRGTYVADHRRRSALGRGMSGEDTHGISIPIRRPWISGTLQTIRLEDPGDPQLKLALSARLGPAANQHFDDHVVSGQSSIGDDERRAPDAPRHSGRHVEDDPDPDIRVGGRNKALLKQIDALPDDELANLLLAIDRVVLLERLNRLDKAGDWQGMSVFRRLLAGPAAEQRLAALGRSAVKAHNHALAGRAAAAAAALHPQSFEANYLAGSAKSLQGEFDEALRFLRAAARLEEGSVRAKREMAIALGKQLRGELSADRREEIRSEHLALLRELSASADAGIQIKYRVPYASALFAAGRYDEAIEAADAVLAAAPNDTRALTVKARALVARNAIAEAHALYERILDLEPGHRLARMNLRILATLVEDETREHAGAETSVAKLGRRDAARESGAIREQEGDGNPRSSLALRLAGMAQSWVCIADEEIDADASPQIRAALAANQARRLGYLEVRRPGSPKLELWRRDALAGLAESGLLDTLDDPAVLDRWKPYYGAREANQAGSGAPAIRRGAAVLTSRHGATLYGGGEHFLEDAAEHHARQGYDPIIVGTRAELRGRDGIANGRRFVFIGDTAADMRKFVLENDVSLVHAISGMGYVVAEALKFTNIAFIYGVHFWNELLGDPHHAGYFDEATGAGLFRREFLLILSRATAIYANSRYTQKVIEDGYGVRCPIVSAAPRERT